MKLPKINLKKIAKLPSYQAIILALGIVFGLLVAAQWQSMPTRVTNPLAPYLSLKETRDMLLDEQNKLKEEIAKDQIDIKELQKGLKTTGDNKEKLALLEDQKAKAGLSKISGPGIVINLDDAKQGTVSDDSIVHASDLRDIVNLLWGAGAEVISINGERVVTNTSIDCIVNTILINNTHISTPFKIEVIGDQHLLLAQTRNKDNLSDLYRRHNDFGLIFDLSETNDLSLGAYSGSFDLKTGS